MRPPRGCGSFRGRGGRDSGGRGGGGRFGGGNRGGGRFGGGWRDEGPPSQVMMEGTVATSYAEGDKFYIDPVKLLPLARFLPQPKGQSVGGRGGRGGRGPPGRGRGRGAPLGRGRGRGPPRGRGGFSRGRGRAFF
ncbi:hypothetical protein Bca101_033308 [Brassica carinata]